MLPDFEHHVSLPAPRTLAAATHVLVVLTLKDGVDSMPFGDALTRVLRRRRKTLHDLMKTPLSAEVPGGVCSWVVHDPAAAPFARSTVLRKAVQSLLGEQPRTLTIVNRTGDAEVGEAAAYIALANGARLPTRKKKASEPGLGKVVLYGAAGREALAVAKARAEGNFLCRELTVLPPNELTPGEYRRRIRAMSRKCGWRHEEFDMKRLRRMGAGAFVAVAQGSPAQDAAIVHLTYRSPRAKKTVALIGKGICFDTGGHNLKPARYMHGMHEDMNGSAVVLGLLLAASKAKLEVNLDCWLAIAENHISPAAYRQNEVIRALNGTTIEIVHTDAEGRMVLSDTLALAARSKPDLMVTFATLTGSMHAALGDRYSGVFATSDELGRSAVQAGVESAERVCLFPMDEDYDSALDSDIADVKQCTMEGGADHILAVRLLQRFTESRPWIHMDLSGSSCKGGLGAIGSDVTGFGVSWGMKLLSMRGRE
jgi:leucyl aminopeptidase